jgi:hypothetical protein
MSSHFLWLCGTCAASGCVIVILETIVPTLNGQVAVIVCSLILDADWMTVCFNLLILMLITFITDEQ